MVAANDVWAVGYTINGSVRQTLTMHWDGSSWTIITSPNPSTSYNELLGVTALGATDVWAVGDIFTAGAYQTLAMHWDGALWTVVATPNVSTSQNTLYAVTAASPSDVWAVGTRQDRSGPIPINRTLTEHWNGSAWSVVASPNVGGNDNLLNGVGATSGDVWTVGSSEVTDHTLILRATG